jgi:hypothetical protein
MARDRIQPLKIEDPGSGGTETDDFPTSADRNEDYVDTRGIVVQSNISDDEVVVIERDVSDDLTFTDPNAGTYTLSDLAGGGGMTEETHRKLDQLVHDLAESCYEEYTYTDGKVTNCTVWETSGKLKKIREEQYTYDTGKISTVVTVQYNTSGNEFERLTETYAYSGVKITSVTAVRSTP